MTTPEDDTTRSPLEHLRRQRAYKRGLVTKAQKKIKSLLECHPNDWDPLTIEDLSEELSSAITAHDALQLQIDDLVFEDAKAFDQEQAEADKHKDNHSALRLSLKRVQQQQKLWNDSHSLIHEMERLSASSDRTTSRFSSKLDELAQNCKPLFNSPPTLHSHSAIMERITSLRQAIDEFSEAADTAAAATTSTTSTPSSSDSSTNRPRMAPLNLDIPKFTGDPLQWESFELSLRSLLKHRAEGFSDSDKFAIVRQAIVPFQGKSLIADLLKRGESTDKLLDELKKMFGRPQLVIPILVQKVTEPPKTDQTAQSLRKFKETVLDNYRALDAHVNGDLGLFMPHFLRPFLCGKLKEDWERLLFEK